jgi:hypothetical protein
MCAGDANWWTAHQRSRVSVALSWLRSSAFKVWRRASASSGDECENFGGETVGFRSLPRLAA